jgi:hypothetical protein
MNGTLRALLGKADAIPEQALLWVNVALAGVVALSHGGALALTYSRPTPDAESIRQIAMFSLPIAAIVVVTAAIALFRADLRHRVLGIHGIVLAGSAMALLLWAGDILVRGIPEGGFSWGVGLLSAWVAYSFFILCRFSVPVALRSHPLIFYTPFFALVVALPIDVGVFIRLATSAGPRLG